MMTEKEKAELRSAVNTAELNGAFASYEFVWSSGLRTRLLLCPLEVQKVQDAIANGMNGVFLPGAGFVSTENLKQIHDIDGQIRRAAAIDKARDEAKKSKSETRDLHSESLLAEAVGKDPAGNPIS